MLVIFVQPVCSRDCLRKQAKRLNTNCSALWVRVGRIGVKPLSSSFVLSDSDSLSASSPGSAHTLPLHSRVASRPPPFNSPYQLQKYTHSMLRIVLVIFVRVGRIGVKPLSSSFVLSDSDSLSASSPGSAHTLPLHSRVASRPPPFNSPYQLQKYTHSMLRIVLVIFVRVGRIELPSVAWEATILPLNDTRI